MMTYTVHPAQHRHTTTQLSAGPCFVLCLAGTPVVATDRIGGRTILVSGQQTVTFSALSIPVTDEIEAEDLADLAKEAAAWPNATPMEGDRWLLDLSGPNLIRVTFAKDLTETNSQGRCPTYEG